MKLRQSLFFILMLASAAFPALLLTALFPAPAVAQFTPSNNIPVILLASSAQTATLVNTADQINAQWGRAHILINVTTQTSGSYTFAIQGKDPASGTYYNVCAAPESINAVGFYTLKLGVGFNALSTAACADMLPRTWRVQLLGTSTPIMTLSIGAFLAP